MLQNAWFCFVATSALAAPQHPSSQPQQAPLHSVQSLPQQPPATGTNAQPIRQTNPWETPPAFRHASPAESWLQSATTINPAPLPSHPPSPKAAATPQPLPGQGGEVTSSTGVAHWYQQGKALPTLKELHQSHQMTFMTQQQQQLQAMQQQQQKAKQNGTAQTSNGTGASATPLTNTNPWSTHAPLGPTSSDPFDAAWATKSPNSAKSSQSSNPFQSTGDTITQTFKVQL